MTASSRQPGRRTHFLTRRVDNTRLDILVRWAAEPTGQAVVFVHGFGGTAIGSFEDFHVLSTRRPDLAGCDLIFFGYDSVRLGVTDAASELFDLLITIALFPGRLFENSKPHERARRPDSFEYERLVIVGHSLGAVVARAALLRTRTIHKPGPLWSQTRSLFFAPAHCGARPVELMASVALPWPIQLVKRATLLWRSPALDDLQRGGSYLAWLQSEVREGVRGGSEHLRASTIHVRDDGVVFNCVFADDFPPQLVWDHDHRSVCKPTRDYLDPVEALSAQL